jgi:uncharacterized protein
MKLYIASTAEYSGKTLLALSLAKLWGVDGVSVGYVKPLGKLPIVEEGGRIVDDDAAFLARELGLPGSPEEVCPVVITQDILMAAYHGRARRLKERIARAVTDAAARTEVLLVGGTANLRDGIFLGLPPLALIEAFDCRVLLVDRFEGEKSMDQILWAADVLSRRLLGVVLNRVAPAQQTFVNGTVRPCLRARGIRVFGAVPHDPVLDGISVGTLAERLGATIACGEEVREQLIERFSIGAMDAEQALRVFRRIPAKAVVTGGNRADIQLAALETDTRCLVLTGGLPPDKLILQRAKERRVPILVAREDTMTVIERFEKLIGRQRIREKEKSERGIRLVGAHVDAEGILSALRRSGSGG